MGICGRARYTTRGSLFEIERHSDTTSRDLNIAHLPSQAPCVFPRKRLRKKGSLARENDVNVVTPLPPPERTIHPFETQGV